MMVVATAEIVDRRVCRGVPVCVGTRLLPTTPIAPDQGFCVGVGSLLPRLGPAALRLTPQPLRPDAHTTPKVWA